MGGRGLGLGLVEFFEAGVVADDTAGADGGPELDKAHLGFVVTLVGVEAGLVLDGIVVVEFGNSTKIFPTFKAGFGGDKDGFFNF